MGVDFTGGGFEQLARETEKLRADAARLRTVTQEATASTTKDEASRRRLAERARAATTRTVAEAETIITRGAQAAGVGDASLARGVSTARTQVDRLALSSEKALRPIQQLRQWGPYAFGRSAQGAEALARSMERIGLVGRYAVPGAQTALGGPGAATRGLNERMGYQPLPIGTRQTYNAQAVDRYSASVSRAATSHAVLNAQMARHGALSSEFLQQLARGNVGLREFGNNLVVTAGKFGGWLAAGAGIFALLGTLGAVGSGAISAASGVNQLQRVVNNVQPDRLQGQLTDLSEHFNVPIDVASDAAYQMGKVFHDQDQAIEASKSVLYAYKVGELDVATASRYLTAIVNGFNLSADKQSQVFDQLNQAQNKYNISISSVLAGTSKAAGSFKLAGGDVTHLIALITTLSKVSGQTGDVIGTAIQRSPHFIAMDQNKALLQQYKIDPTGDIEQIYARAIKTAEHLAPEKQRQLAEALFGPQYGARVGVFLLQHGDLFKQVLQDVSPSAASGSAERELQTTLGSARELITRVGTELGALGANLARSGFFDLLLLGVAALDKMLLVVNDILAVFNLLPQPMRHLLALAAELYVLFRLMRRFNVGSTLPGLAGQAFTNPRNAVNDTREASIVRQSELSNELVTASNQVTRAELERTVAQERMRVLTGQETSAVRGGTANIAASSQAGQQALTARRSLADYDQAVFEARVRESVVAREQARVTEQIAALRKKTPGIQTGSMGLPFQPSGEPTPGSRFGPTTGAMGIPFQRSASALQANMQQFGVVAGALNTGVQQVRSGASRLSTRIQGINWRGGASAVRAAGTRLATTAKGLAGMISPLDLAFAAVAAFAVGWQQLGDSINKSQDVISTSPGSFAEAQQQAEAARSAMQSAPSSVYIPGKYEEALHAQEEASKVADERVYAAQQFEIAIDRLALGEKLAPEERAAYKSGTYQDVYEGMAASIRKRIFQHELDLKTGEKLLDQLVKRARTDSHIDDPESLIQSIRDTGTGDAATQNAETLQKRAELAAARGPLYDTVGNARRAVEAAKDARDVLKKQGANRSDVMDAEIAVAQADRDLRQAVDDQAKSILDARGALQQSKTDPNRTIIRARDELDQAKAQVELAKDQDRPKEDILQAEAAVNNARFAVEQAVRERMSAMIDIATRMRVANAPLYSPLVEQRTAVEAAVQKLRVLRQHGGTPQEIKDAAATVAEAQRELALAVDERAKALLDARGALALSTIDPNDAVARAAQAANTARQQLALLQRQGRDKVDILQAMAAVNDAEASLQQAVEERAANLLEIRGELALARIDPEHPVAQARQAAENARDTYRLMIAQGRTREEIMRAYLAMVQAEAQVDQAIEQRAEEIRHARFDVQAARAESAGNEVRQAAIAARTALYDLRHADSRTERLAARAALIRARSQRRDAIFQTQIDDIEFQADIGKLTLQEQIRAYQRLLHTLQLTRDQRRDLKRRIEQLRHDSESEAGEFELKVGDIRLPTIYEIRRAIGAGTATQQTSVTVNQTNNFTANGDQAGAAVQTMQDQLSRAGDRTRNALRSAGL